MFLVRTHQILLSFLFLCAAAILYVSFFNLPQKENDLRVHFFDVGQGDATFIESPNGVQILIDGGPDSGVLRELSHVMGFFDRSIDLVIATHPDKDHIGGLVDVLERYDVETILITENESNTSVSELLQELITREGADIVYARSGQIFTFDGAVLHILFPDRNVRDLESNTSSIVTRLVYGEIEFIFTGDSPRSIEEYLVRTYGNGLKSDVLKVGHHGSKTSTAEAFASAVDPGYAVISSGENNRYGHPHEAVTRLLKDKNITTLYTEKEGTITLYSDGVDIGVR